VIYFQFCIGLLLHRSGARQRQSPTPRIENPFFQFFMYRCLTLFHSVESTACYRDLGAAAPAHLQTPLPLVVLHHAPAPLHRVPAYQRTPLTREPLTMSPVLRTPDCRAAVSTSAHAQLCAKVSFLVALPSPPFSYIRSSPSTLFPTMHAHARKLPFLSLPHQYHVHTHARTFLVVRTLVY